MDEIKLSDETKTNKIAFTSQTIIIKKFFFILMVCLILLLSILLVVFASLVKTTTDTNTTDSVTGTTISWSTSTADPFGPGPWESEYLPDTITPIEYNLNIRVFRDDNLYNGFIQINAVNSLSDNNIVMLHASNLIMEYPQVFLIDKDPMVEKKQVYVIESFLYNDYYVMILGTKLPADSLIQIELQFERELDSDESKGFFARRYLDFDAKSK